MRGLAYLSVFTLKFSNMMKNDDNTHLSHTIPAHVLARAKLRCEEFFVLKGFSVLCIGGGSVKAMNFVITWKVVSLISTGAFGVLGLLKEFKNKETKLLNGVWYRWWESYCQLVSE